MEQGKLQQEINMNPEQQIADLQAQIESAKAQIAQIKADMQVEKADEVKKKGFADGFNDTKSMILTSLQDRQLQGNRDADGNFTPENTSGKPMELKPDLGKGSVSSATRKRTKEEEEILKAIMDGEELTDEQYEITNQMSMEDFEATGIPVVEKKIFGIDEDEDDGMHMMPNGKMMKDSDMDTDERTDEESARQVDMGNPDQDRRMAMEDDIEDRSMGFKADDGGNMSVNEKDDFWKTQEGYDKAMEMYGSKPAWVKEPTMQWNPVEQEYEKISEEDKDKFEDLSIADNIKQLFG